ncbi:MAG TPA: bifunctional diguanylate cyclase/phosphodiesterase [Gammaproteobacteria bacterium]|jgi:diguanylate cyclase (GGDEF)-like protein
MTEPFETVVGAEPGAASAAGVYAPYGQLIKMLLPRCGGIAVYGADRELLWCSDGCERPDLRSLLDDTEAERISRGGSIRAVSGSDSAFVYVLRNEAGDALGTLVVELADSQRRHTNSSMVASLLRPVLDCLENRVDVESTKAAMPALRMPAPAAQPADIRFLLEVGEGDRAESDGLEYLVRQCAMHLQAVVGALIIPDRNLTICCATDGDQDAQGQTLLTKTHKHLLAWLQLHNRAMVVNRVSADASAKHVPSYKILSCPVHDANNRVIGLLGLFRAVDAEDFEERDVSIVEFMSRKAMNLLTNRYDDLTGLLNRYAFERGAQAVLDSSEEDSESALLYLDIDGLHVINSAFGFHAGDEVIQRLAVVIREHVAAEGIAGRLGADRFVVMLPPSASIDPEALAERLRAAMSQLTYMHGNRATPVSVSIGVGRIAGSGQTISHAIAAAEFACKRAKQLGRNRVEVSHADNPFAVAHRSDAIAFANLQSALKANRFGLEAQPIHRLDNHSAILGHEILMRMKDGNEYVGPDKFLAAAQRYHLLPALDRWVLGAMLRTFKANVSTLIDVGWISINVSAQSFQSDSFREFLLEQLQGSGLPPQSFCVELRESSAAHHMQEAETFIRSLHKLGVKIALDDFGRGLSSLAYLRTLPVQYIKIDGDLVRRVATDRVAESMVLAIAQAARSLEIDVIAEHVETEAIASKLAMLGIRYGQGFYLSRPQALPVLADEATAVVRQLRLSAS